MCIKHAGGQVDEVRVGGLDVIRTAPPGITMKIASGVGLGRQRRDVCVVVLVDQFQWDAVVLAIQSS